MLGTRRVAVPDVPYDPGMAPEGLRYTTEHEWVRREEDGSFTIGITDYAANALGDVVYVQLPDRGASVGRGQVLGEVESTKSVSEFYAPLAGRVVDRNDAVGNQPDTINTDPFGEGWLVRVEADNPADYDELVDAAAYASLTS